MQVYKFNLPPLFCNWFLCSKLNKSSMSSLSDAFKTHPLHLDNSPLDFKALKCVPDSHTWSSLAVPGSSSVEAIPIIDLTEIDAVDRIGRACEQLGVFQVTNHGVPVKLLNEIESEARRLFMLPTEQKLKVVREPNGISGYGIARISPFYSKLMWHEGFSIAGSPAEYARKLWPQDYTSFCDVMEEFEKEMKKVTHRVMCFLVTYLGLTLEDIMWVGPSGQLDMSPLLQLNSYPACPHPDRAMGLAEHTDTSILTILYQSSASGLQVLKDGTDEWVTVGPLDGALVVIVGDLLHILSNGRFRSTIHRAVVNRTNHRISIGCFWGPEAHVKVSPLSKLVTVDHPPLYRSVTWNEYLRIKAESFNNALSLIRLPPPFEQSATRMG